MLDEKQAFHPYGAWLCLYFVATTISPLCGYDQSGLTVGSDAQCHSPQLMKNPSGVKCL
jgi:hypothetical protein